MRARRRIIALESVPMAAVLGLLLLAGAEARANDSTPTVRIEGGTYTIGTNTGPPDARPAHRVTLRPFLIDQFEVTNADYARFLNTLDVTIPRDAPAGQVRREHLRGPYALRLLEGASPEPFVDLDDVDSRIALGSGRFVPEPGYEEHPATEVTWYGARAYCAWRQARLPTEAEWEAAARGQERRTYPWGEALPTPERAVFARPRGHTEPVGSRPAGATSEGVHDLAGSLAEWTSTLYRPYPYDAIDGREDPNASGERVTRGGDYVFDTAPDKLTTFFRSGFSRAPDRGHRHIGFRCVRSFTPE